MFRFLNYISKKQISTLLVIIIFISISIFIFKPNLKTAVAFSNDLVPIFKDSGLSQIDSLSDKQLPKDIQSPLSDYYLARQENFDMQLLNTRILEILGQDSDQYGVSIILPTLGLESGVNFDKVFPPASISKLPIAILILKDVDSGRFSLDTKIVLKEGDKAYETDSLYYYDSGTSLTIKEYLRFMLVESDNTAMTVLERFLGGVELINSRTTLELGIKTLSRLPMEATSQDIAKIWQGIYNQDYLSSSSNNLLLEYLTNTASWFQDRIAKGVPTGTRVAHKIGQIVTEYGMSYNDSGIIYGPKHDFIIVVINQDIDQVEATSKIIQITKAAYNFFEN